MQFFARVRDAMARFMYGRNGVDQLNIAMLWVSIGADLLATILMRQQNGLAYVGLVLYYGSVVLWVLVLFRMFSRNLYKRQGPPGGHGAQILHLQALQDHLPGAGGQGQGHHHLPQVRRGDPRQDLRIRGTPQRASPLLSKEYRHRLPRSARRKGKDHARSAETVPHPLRPRGRGRLLHPAGGPRKSPRHRRPL